MKCRLFNAGQWVMYYRRALCFFLNICIVVVTTLTYTCTRLTAFSEWERAVRGSAG